MSLRGYIDGVIGDELVGWALDDDALGSRLRVRGELDGIVLGTVEASEPRRDLVTAGFGDGGYGFRIALDPALLTPGTHPVAAVVGGHSLPLAHDWIVRDVKERPIEDVNLAPGVPVAGGGAGDRAAVAAPVPAIVPRPVPAPLAAQDARHGVSIAPPRPLAGSVLTGIAGWSFVIPARMGARSHAQLDADAAAIEELHALAASAGVAARAVAIPAKHLLYAEHLAPEQRPDPGARGARALVARLRDSGDAWLLDLYEAMQDARAHGRLYPRTGTTLTWVGAIHAYRAITKSLPPLRPQPLDAFGFGRLVAATNALDPSDTEPVLTRRPPAAPHGSPAGLVVHDGTAGRVAELLRMNFWRCHVVVADRVDPELVSNTRPDIIVWIREDQ